MKNALRKVCLFYLNTFFARRKRGGGDKIAAAMDGGTENDIKAAIAEYISGEYNPLIIAYVYSVNWLAPAPGGIVPIIDINI